MSLEFKPKRLGMMHRLSAPMHTSLLLMLRNTIPSQTRIDNTGLKLQRDEKRKKDELALKANQEKACEEHIEVLHRWDKYENG